MESSKTIYKEGYSYVNKQGLDAEVIQYNGRKDILVRLSDGFVGKTNSTAIKKGFPFSNKYGKIKVGDLLPTKFGDTVEIMDYVKSTKVKVKWLSDGTEKWVGLDVIKAGILKHPLKNKVYIGEVYKTKHYGDIKVVEVNSATDIVVEFESGELKKTSVRAILAGNVATELRSTKVSIGQEFKSNSGWSLKVLEYNGFADVKVEWEDGSISTESAADIAKGSVLCLNQPTSQGVGYWGYGKYPPRNHILKEGQEYPDERIVGYWSRAISRCYNIAEQAKPSSSAYVGCDILKEWHCLQNFYTWADSKPQSRYLDNEGKIWELDKDLLVKGNKTYGEMFCTFLPPEVNVFLGDKPRDKMPRGVNHIQPKTPKSKDGYIARCHINGVREYLGYYDTPMEAFVKYKEAKESHARTLAEKWRGMLESVAYEALMAYQVEPYD